MHPLAAETRCDQLGISQPSEQDDDTTESLEIKILPGQAIRMNVRAKNTRRCEFEKQL